MLQPHPGPCHSNVPCSFPLGRLWSIFWATAIAEGIRHSEHLPSIRKSAEEQKAEEEMRVDESRQRSSARLGRGIIPSPRDGDGAGRGE